MPSELLLCPFCGEEVEWHKYSQTARRIARQNGQPLVQMIDCTNKECGATFSFNTPIKSLAKSECRKAFNTRAERTCRMETGYSGYDSLVCSECGEYTTVYHKGKYCSGCGAKVVE